MGDVTVYERVIELEGAVKSLASVVGVLVARAEDEDRRKLEIADRMSKMRAKRGKKKRT